MSSVWGELGYDQVVKDVADYLGQSDDIVVIQGPPGAGKSWLAKGIGSIWEQAGGCTAVAEGDVLRSDVSLYPLGFALAGLGSVWRSAEVPITNLARAGESLAGTGGLITGTVTSIAGLRPSRVRARALFLGDVEQQILFDLERLAQFRPLLIVADNLHWWDARSLELLGRLRTRTMQEAFPFLAGLRVIAVQTVEPFQPVTSPAAHSAFLAPATTRPIDLERVPQAGFAAVLEALGAPHALAVEHGNAVFALTGGHLALARRCALRLAEGEVELFTGYDDIDEFIDRLLSERIRTLGEVGTDAVELLQIAAVLGLRFRRDEVTCARGGLVTETSRLLRYLRDQDLIELTDDAGWFVHDYYRQHFLSGSLDRTSIHERLGDCLRRLSPGDYELRCQNATLAEQVTEAARLAVHARLARQRDGQPLHSLPDGVVAAIAAGRLSEVTLRLSSALHHVRHDRYEACLAELSSLPHSLPRELLAEADYIRATCLMTTRSDEDRARGRSLLESWDGIEEEEPELGSRILQLLLFGLTMVADKTEGRLVERRLQRVLRMRAAFDQSAEDAMYVLDRCSASLYEPDHALVRVEEATAYFRPPQMESVIRRPVEYYRCLTNLMAELVANARYGEARSVSTELERLVSSHEAGLFPRLDHARTTALLADYRVDAVDSATAAIRQQEILERDGVDDDPFYATNAWAVYRCLAGDALGAAALYRQMLILLQSRRSPEPSMLYLLRANSAAVSFTSGEPDIAEEWAALSELIVRVPYPIGRFLVRRHELLADVIRRGVGMTPGEFDTCLTDGRAEFGPMWDQLGRGFRMPEVEWWH